MCGLRRLGFRVYDYKLFCLGSELYASLRDSSACPCPLNSAM